MYMYMSLSVHTYMFVAVCTYMHTTCTCRSLSSTPYSTTTAQINPLGHSLAYGLVWDQLLIFNCTEVPWSYCIPVPVHCTLSSLARQAIPVQYSVEFRKGASLVHGM